MAELWPGGPIELPHDITLDGVLITVPEVPSTTLLSWLSIGAWWSLVPAALDPEELMPFLLRFQDEEDEFDYEHLWDVGVVLFGRLAGMGRDGGPGWWPARRLAATAVTHWPQYTAWCAAHGTDPVDGPLWQIMGRVYAWLRERAGPQQVDRLDHQIWEPPPFEASAVVPQHVRDEEARMALAALGEVGGGEVAEGGRQEP